MSRQFEVTYNIENVYCTTAPVVIREAGIYKDRDLGTKFFQIKFQSISDKIIKNVTVNVKVLDAEDNIVENIIDFNFDVITGKAGDIIGVGKLIIINDESAVKFAIYNIKVTFDDKTEWVQSSVDRFVLLPAQKELLEVLGEKELVDEYSKAVSNRANYQPIEFDNVWMCTCGIVNKNEKCCGCGADKNDSIEKCNKDVLQELIEEEKEIKRIADEDSRRELKKSIKQDKKNKARIIIIAIIAVVVIAGAIVAGRMIKTNGKVSTDSLVYGDEIEFGSYEQNNNTEDGSEPIKWVVSDFLEEDYVILTSVYGLDLQPYNTENKAVTWETCSLRKWLNEDFCNSAFNKEEKAAMSKVNLENPDNSYDGSKGGAFTLDLVWIFNEYDARKYIEITEINAGQVATTEYVQAMGIEDVSSYWLRSPNAGSSALKDVYTASVAWDDSNFGVAYGKVTDKHVVRPVILLKVSKDIKVRSCGCSFFEDDSARIVD